MEQCYVISLNDAKKKIKYLKKHGLSPTLYHGVRGSLLDPQVIKCNTSPFYSVFGPKSAIGCAMSHIGVWEQILDGDKDHAIVFEDDVVLVKEFKQHLDIIFQSIPKDFDILYLGGFGTESNLNAFTVLMTLCGNVLKPKTINKHIKVPKVALGTHAYMLSKKGAKKLVRALKGNIFHHIDFCILSLAKEGKIKLYSCTPRLAYQTSTNTGISENVLSVHPRALHHMLSQWELDVMVRGHYISTLAFARINNTNINLISVMFFIAGIVLAHMGFDIETVTCIFAILSFPDLIYEPIETVVFHYVLFIIPHLQL